ncbi:MAG: methylmalonyl-CoA mutase, partial [Firmicutes bacterium]|nr:methylmalonyl-CoA mutase [Bacillota bacterium]
ANGIAYVQAAIDTGQMVDEFAPRLSFFFNSHIDFLEEIAKFRAARRLWARIMRERFRAANPRSWMLRFHTQTAGCTLTAQQPRSNMVRVALQALSAALGGTQSLHTNSWDEALALPSEEAATLALRTQQIIAYESGIGDTVDPLGGSYYIEDLTSRLEAEAQDYLDRIGEMGGAVQAIEQGFIQQEIQDSAYRYQREIEDGDRVVVGVNKFSTAGEETPSGLLRVDPEVETHQCARLAAVRRDRDQGRVERCLADLRRAAAGTDNLMPFLLEAVKAYASLGEISDVLRETFGEYTAPQWV